MSRARDPASSVLLALDAKLIRERRIRLRQLHSGSIGPKPIEIVKLAHRLIKNMDDDVGKIHQDPLAPGGALDGMRANPHPAQTFIEVLGDALHLPVGAAGTNNKIIGDGGKL